MGMVDRQYGQSFEIGPVAGEGAGFFFSAFMPLMSRKTQNATMTKSRMTLMLSGASLGAGDELTCLTIRRRIWRRQKSPRRSSLAESAPADPPRASAARESVGPT